MGMRLGDDDGSQQDKLDLQRTNDKEATELQSKQVHTLLEIVESVVHDCERNRFHPHGHAPRQMSKKRSAIDTIHT